MNKNSINKIVFFLKGIESRISENKDYFLRIEMGFQSGTKEFKSYAELVGEDLNFIYIGQKILCPVRDLNKILSEYLPGYDRFILRYIERGRTYVLEADDKNVKMNTEDNTVGNLPASSLEHNFSMQEREYYIKPGQADQLLKVIGVLSENNKIKNDMIRKYNQLDYFIEILIKHFSVEISEKEMFRFIDCACGKSYLTFALNYYLTDVLKKRCFATGIDYSKTVIDASKKMADALQYKNMEFIKTDISEYTTSQPFDLLISLHACDIATDYAISYGINNRIPNIVVVPCCHKQMLESLSFRPFDPIFKHGIFKTRMNDTVTDGLRTLLLESMGYKVSVFEYISPLETPKNIMILAKKQRGFDEKTFNEYLEIKKMLSVEPMLEQLIR